MIASFSAILWSFVFVVNSPHGSDVAEAAKATEKVKAAGGIISWTVLNDDEKQYAVDRHNQARSVANPTAMNMLKLSWDEELAQRALAYSRECIYAHSDTDHRQTSKFDFVGENLYISHPEVAPTKSLDAAVTYWDDEKYNYTFNTTDCIGECGHYTQVLWDDTYAVGCGITTCKDIYTGDGETWAVGQLVVCHYGPGGNINGRRPYVRGTSCRVCPRDYWCENRLCTNGLQRLAAPSLTKLFLFIIAQRVLASTGLLER